MDFRNTKIRIKSPEHSKAFQEAVLAAGGKWCDRSRDGIELDSPYIYVTSRLGIAFGDSDDAFKYMDYTEITFPERRGHPHAELMALYAGDAKTNAKPWELWEFKPPKGNWAECGNSPIWISDFEYRRKPNFKVIHGVEVPDISFEPADNELYYRPEISAYSLFTLNHFCDELAGDVRMSAFGLCYPPTYEGEQAAILHAKAMMGFANKKD